MAVSRAPRRAGALPRAAGRRAAVRCRAGLCLVPAAVNLPHPDKVAKGGEDAWFVRVDREGGSIGVADGVGGSAENGIDPGLYARVLMLEAAKADAAQAGAGARDPRAVIDAAHKATELPGASTAVVCQLDGARGVLTAANLGDSGFRVIRGGEVAFASPALQHFFDCPYQLSYELYNEVTDFAEDAETFEVKLEAGDVILAASDGVFDNVYDRDLLAAAAEAGAAATDEAGVAEAVARAVAELARRNAGDAECESPYAAELAKSEGGANPMARLDKLFGRKAKAPTGGKMDDITVVTAFVADAAAVPKAALDRAAGDASKLEKETEKVYAQAQVVMEKRKLQDQVERAARAAVEKAAAAEAAKKAAAPPVFSPAQIESMDKADIQKALQGYGLPTSGKLSALKERLATVKK